MSERAKAFAQANQITFNNLNLLVTALTHPSYAQEQGMTENNQRLEFLGDAVLNLVVANYLYIAYPNQSEGVLTKIRAKVVCERYLAKFARALNLGDYLILGRGEENSGGRNRNSILADALEAVIGALFLDQGLEYTESFILKNMQKDIDAVADGDFYDYKSRLQELVQSMSRENVTYNILKETGPAHDRTFVAGVSFQSRLLATGTGKTKKEAEQKAAERALKELIK
ncbi:MAG: ribonuclease III [Syntrophomonadaceae bacterium]|nr:ribonuclease III [Syntrophomonadaceae bacterium]